MAERMNNLTGKEWLQNSFTIWRDVVKTSEERATKHPALFPQELVEKLIRLYLRDPGSRVLDPFMGIGSTVLASMNQGMKGIGFDLSNEFCAKARSRVESFNEVTIPDTKVIEPEIYNLDSRNISNTIRKESIDLVVTSPPYWDILNQKRTADGKIIRNYSDNLEDLGNIPDYELFLTDLKQVYTEVFKVLKPGARCIAVVMDIRKKDKFYPLHEDQSRIMREIGFELDEYVIWDRQRDYNNMKTLGYPYVYRFNRVHEFICIYLKRKEVIVKPDRPVATVKKATVKKATVKKATVKKATVKKATVKKATVKKATVKKATVKKSQLKSSS
jgi:DNA modification methylase